MTIPVANGVGWWLGLACVSKFILAVSLLLYFGFVAMLAISHVEDPSAREGWMLLTVGFNVVGSLLYYLTKCQDFRSHEMVGFVAVGGFS